MGGLDVGGGRILPGLSRDSDVGRVRLSRDSDVGRVRLRALDGAVARR
jgi:hypothetical protein